MDNHIFDCFSIENLPMSNARVAFVTKTTEVFRDSGRYETRQTPDGKEYVSWGGDNQLPYSIIRYIEEDETLSTCQVFNAEVCYGSGLRYCTEEASQKVKDEVEDFLIDNPLPDYFLGVCQDLKHFNFAVSVIIMNEGNYAIGSPLKLRPTLSQAQCSENVLVVLIPLGDKGSCQRS